MVDSFNVSVASGILMHHAVCDRTSRLVRIYNQMRLTSETFKFDSSTLQHLLKGCVDLRFGTDYLINGAHGDLTSSEKQILLAEFSLRHSRSSISIAQEYAKRKVGSLSKL
ncbi:hypothetical protein Tco_0864664 [Tanacetum coccineum]